MKKVKKGSITNPVHERERANVRKMLKFMAEQKAIEKYKNE